MRRGLALSAVVSLTALSGCGGDDEGGGASKTEATSETATTETERPGRPGTVDGSWAGSTRQGKDFSFRVAGNKISKVSIPGNDRCGTGVDSTISSSTTFKGSKFEVPGLPLPYKLYDRSGQSQSLQEQRSVVGRFSSDSRASGTIVTKVTGDQAERCVQKWTATKGF